MFKKYRKLLIVSVVSGVIGLALFIIGSKRDSEPLSPIIQEEQQSPENKAENPEILTETAQKPIDIINPDLTKDIEEVWVMLKSASSAVNKYFNRFIDVVAFVSKNGYLYDSPAKSYVMAKDLLDLTDFPYEYKDESIIFLYIKPADLDIYLESDVSDKEALEIFVAYETKDGFALISESGILDIILREDLKTVLESYKWDNGEIRKVLYDDFENVLKVIAEYEQYSGNYDVRYMYRDNKYVSVVLSKEGSHKSLEQHVLEYFNETLKMRVSDIQNANNPKVFVNSAIPDFDLELLPDYNINEFAKYIFEGFSEEMTKSMISRGMISESDLPVTFETGAMDFVYIELASGKNYLGFFVDNIWEIALVEDYELMIQYMKTQSRRAPLFIIKQY